MLAQKRRRLLNNLQGFIAQYKHCNVMKNANISLNALKFVLGIWISQGCPYRLYSQQKTFGCREEENGTSLSLSSSVGSGGLWVGGVWFDSLSRGDLFTIKI